jgi:hypothetical protein
LLIYSNIPSWMSRSTFLQNSQTICIFTSRLLHWSSSPPPPPGVFYPQSGSGFGLDICSVSHTRALDSDWIYPLQYNRVAFSKSKKRTLINNPNSLQVRKSKERAGRSSVYAISRCTLPQLPWLQQPGALSRKGKQSVWCENQVIRAEVQCQQFEPVLSAFPPIRHRCHRPRRSGLENVENMTRELNSVGSRESYMFAMELVGNSTFRCEQYHGVIPLPYKSGGRYHVVVSPPPV